MYWALFLKPDLVTDSDRGLRGSRKRGRLEWREMAGKEEGAKGLWKPWEAISPRAGASSIEAELRRTKPFGASTNQWVSLVLWARAMGQWSNQLRALQYDEDISLLDIWQGQSLIILEHQSIKPAWEIFLAYIILFSMSLIYEYYLFNKALH